MKERKSADAKFPEELTPMYIEDISRGPSEVDAMGPIREAVDFRKLELYAAFGIEKEDGGAPTYDDTSMR